ncbi:MAG: hypothetical protein MMC23_006614 [Stictis urceolatum]|nr:hypothetical protein [Stictis urceolata]
MPPSTPYQIPTPNLLLRPFPTLGELFYSPVLAALYPHRQNPDVMRYSARGAPDQTLEQTLAWLEAQARRPWAFVVCERPAGGVEKAEGDGKGKGKGKGKAKGRGQGGSGREGRKQEGDEGEDLDTGTDTERQLDTDPETHIPLETPIGVIQIRFSSPTPAPDFWSQADADTTPDTNAPLDTTSNALMEELVANIKPRPEIPEIGFWLGPEAQGKGYATEALKAVLGAFWDAEGDGGETGSEDEGSKVIDRSRVDVIEAATYPDNVASEKVLRKAGFEIFERREMDAYVELLGGWLDVVVWRVTRPGPGEVEEMVKEEDSEKEKEETEEEEGKSDERDSKG